MPRRTCLFLCIVTPMIAMMSVSAADPPGFAHWTSAQLKAFESVLAARLKSDNSGSELLGDFGNHSALIVRRENSGRPEFHMRQVDVFIVRTGAATLRMGGELVDGREVRPDEMTGTSINGGVDRTLREGDVVHIPARTSHQILVRPGEQITYLTLKIAAQ